MRKPEQMDIEEFLNPGARKMDTSQEAAKSMRITAATLRDAVFTALRVKGPMTADDTADYLGKHFASIRPRFSELKEKGKIRDSGLRGMNQSGKRAAIWEINN